VLALLVPLVALVLLAGLTEVASAPAVDAATSFSVSTRMPSPVLVGTQITAKGRVTPAAPGRVVRLQRYRTGGWATIREAELDATSRFVFSLPPKRAKAHRLRVVKPASKVQGRSVRTGVSSARTVRVVDTAYHASLTADRTEIFDGATVRFTGAVTPKAAGAVVRLQQETATGWSTVATTTLGKRSRYRFVRAFDTAPQVTRFRVLKPASATVVGGESGPIELRRRTWSSVTAGTYDTCGLTSDDAAWCWGWDSNGEVGNGDLGGTFDTPQPVAGGHRWLTLDAGSESTCGVRRDGSAWCWGANGEGQLGTGSIGGGDATRPVRVVGDLRWRTVSVGYQHACGIADDGTAWCWGRNPSGQLGNGTAGVSSPVPVRVLGGASWRSIDAAGSNTCGVQEDGSAWCWGADNYGQLGDGPDDYSSTPEARSTVPVRVLGPAEWTSVRAGLTACGVAADETGWCWGSNTNNNLGYSGPQDDRSDVPVQLSGDWIDIVPGAGHVCGVQVDASAWCWGVARNGQTGSDTGAVVTNGPVRVAGEGEWASVSAGDNHSCGMQVDRTLWCWGSNESGELGVGDRDTRRTPAQVTTP
jgi:alpha-tubulin suppressor-like RCC1 family protein